MAGVKDYRQARIFCRKLDAELVSIAGSYRVSEDIDERLRGCAAQVFLEDERMRIEPL